MTRPRKPLAPPALKPVPPLEAHDFETLNLSGFADDLGTGPDRPLAVLDYFTDAVRRGYVPPDAILRWLADRFAGYLEGGPKAPRLDVFLGLVPEKRSRGKPGHDVREHAAEAERTRQYVWRLATLDLAGFTKKAGHDALAYLEDGVPNILAKLTPKAGRIDSVESLAPKWRRSDEYVQAMSILQRIEDRSDVLAKLRAYVKKPILD